MMEMEQYRKQMKTRTCLLGAMVCMLPAACLAIWNLISPTLAAQTSLDAGFSDGILWGAVFGFELLLLFNIARNLAALRSEKLLKARYVKENDERERFIMQKTGMPIVRVCAVCFAAAAVVGGFFSKTVFFTLLGALTFMALLKIGMKLYYLRKY